MDTVKESKLNAQLIYRDSLSIHLNNFIVDGILLNPTSKNTIIANNVVITIEVHVINCAPLTPTFLPKNPEIIEPNNGSIIIVKYIFNIL
jgi:hypothetical protein